MTPHPSVQFQLSQLNIQVVWEEGAPSSLCPPRYAPWLEPRGKPDILIRAHGVARLPEGTSSMLLFDAPDRWRVYQEGPRFFFEGVSRKVREIQEEVQWRSWVKSDFHQLDFFILRSKEDAFWWMSLLDPFLLLFLSSLLPFKEGLLLHGLGIASDARGMLFLGKDGGGKSTLGTLWHESGKGTVLNDDRVILRKIGPQWLLFGTPWFGSFRSSLPGGVPLQEICLIEHAPENRLEEVSFTGAFERMMQQLFLAFWKDEAIGKAMALCEELVQTFPVRRFGFAKDPSAVNFFLNSLNNAPSSRLPLPA